MLMLTLVAITLGFILDLIIGDPHSLPHPICLIGNLISWLEKGLRKIFGFSEKGLLCGGAVLVLLVFVMQAFGKVVTWHHASKPKQTLSLHEEEVAAIMTALKLYKSDLHDKESEVLTILSIKRAYSPWSSKIHGLTQLPDRKF